MWRRGDSRLGIQLGSVLPARRSAATPLHRSDRGEFFLIQKRLVVEVELVGAVGRLAIVLAMRLDGRGLLVGRGRGSADELDAVLLIQGFENPLHGLPSLAGEPVGFAELLLARELSQRIHMLLQFLIIPFSGVMHPKLAEHVDEFGAVQLHGRCGCHLRLLRLYG